MPLLMNYRIKKAAIGVLKKELGWKKLLGLLPGLSKKKKRGEPWTELEIAISKKDKDSRELIGEAILLYRELLDILPKADAERIIRNVIVESAVMQLYSLVPKISSKEIESFTSEIRKEKFCQIIDQFPNADWEISSITDKEYGYRIIRCRLVELIIAAGHPELRDAFCMGDGVYFERHQKEIQFHRPKKIGSDDSYCEFIFSLKDK